MTYTDKEYEIYKKVERQIDDEYQRNNYISMWISDLNESCGWMRVLGYSKSEIEDYKATCFMNEFGYDYKPNIESVETSQTNPYSGYNWVENDL